MKFTDYIADFLAHRGIGHVFAVIGGASAHIIDSIARHPAIEYICPQHEQGGAMAADGYARASGGLGCAVATSGPGATNLLTGICSAYYDSIPVLFITGQVATFRMKGNTGVRQIGFQETDILSMCAPVTKYAVQISDPATIRYELEKLCFIALSGRPGPVLIDIPDDLQREEVDTGALRGFVPAGDAPGARATEEQIYQCRSLLGRAQRPVAILGWGIRSAGADKEVAEFLENSGIPFAPTWAAADIFPSDHPLYIGTFGTHGTRYGNFAVQNADLILSVGSRLDTKATGSPIATFARGAKKIVVDIDETELKKFDTYGLTVEVPVNGGAKDFLTRMNEHPPPSKESYSPWLARIAQWKKTYPICPERYYREEKVNPYVLIKELSRLAEEGEILILDTGCTLAWTMQAFDFKPSQRLLHNWNNTAMGWALPASVGASFALERKRILCVTGDGGLQMNIQEMATVIRHRLPIKLLVLNNGGYGMIQQTQDQWFDSRYEASSIESGLAFPDLGELAKVYGFHKIGIAGNGDIPDALREMFSTDGPVFCDVKVSLGHRVTPQVKFGRPNEDLEPLLSRPEFLENMIVEPLGVSLHDVSHDVPD